MRAEAQEHVDRSKAALELLRRFLDWDRALRRLDELNARVEDPTLWDDPKKAQEVMRERTRLDQAISDTKAIQQEMDDTVELMELAEDRKSGVGGKWWADRVRLGGRRIIKKKKK